MMTTSKPIPFTIAERKAMGEQSGSVFVITTDKNLTEREVKHMLEEAFEVWYCNEDNGHSPMTVEAFLF